MASRLKDDNFGNKNDETEELLVFGYSCKLFRDDEKALYIDQGKHLIPWMGDESLKIDRYDARGTLYDLTHVEAPSGGFDRFFGLTDVERQVETMCDEERYRALMTNEEEETMYQEEELKRLHCAIADKGKSYGQVEYKYDGSTKPNTDETAEKTVEKTDNKSDDGADDEPFVPNPQLDIPLNMVLPETMKHNAIIEKTAMFISNQGPQMEILLKMKQAGNPQFNFLAFDNPLHSYYRLLLMAIKGGRYKPDEQNSEKKDVEPDEDEHYLHPSLASSVSKVELAPSIPSINYKPSAHCAYSMLVNKIKDKKARNSEQTVSSHLSKLKQALERFKDEKASEDGSGNDSDSNGSEGSRSSIKSKLNSLLSNNLVNKNNLNVSSQPMEIPPNDMQVIIDKMASYVAKNGRDFETVVQSKKDPRFDFLNSSHKYNAYYQHKVRQYENLDKPVKANEKYLSKLDNSNAKLREDQAKGKLAPVCFSIKKPKETEPVIEKSALPVEESSDDEEKDKEEKEGNGNEEKEKEDEKEKELDNINDNDNEKEKVKEREKEKETEKEKEKEKEEKDKDKEKEKEKGAKEEIVTVDLAAMEEKEERNRKLLAAERLKDKLTAAAREKVALASREKQLQLERKRRAAAFLKTLQSESGEIKVAPLYGPQLPGGEVVERVTDDDSDVASIPEIIEEFKEDNKKVEKHQKREDFKFSPGRYIEERHEDRYRSSSSSVRHKHREKHHQIRSERREKSYSEESRGRDGNDRVSDSSSSEENDKRKVYYSEDYRKIEKRKNSDDSHWKNKCDKIRSSRKEEKRHKRKKHKKDESRDRNSRKHSKSKKKRSRGSDDERSSRNKRSRRSSRSSSGDRNS